MNVVVQSFREFKSFQMANAAASHEALKRYVIAEHPQKYTGPSEVLETHPLLKIVDGLFSRLVERPDLGTYLLNSAIDRFGRRHAEACSLFVGYSGSCLASLRAARQNNATAVVYRGAAHGDFLRSPVGEELRAYGIKTNSELTPRMTAREQREYEVADIVWTNSTFTAESLINAGVSEKKTRIFPYGIDISRFYPDHQAGADDFLLLYVGSVSPEKGVHILLDAFSELNVPRAKLKLVGHIDPRLRNKIESVQNVTATGWMEQSKLTRLYQKASVFVFPSLSDGYASVVVEALASGCPVVTTERVGSKYLVRDYNAGRVVPPNDSVAFRAAIETIAADPNLRTEMSYNAVESIEKEGLSIDEREERMWDFMCDLSP